MSDRSTPRPHCITGDRIETVGLERKNIPLAFRIGENGIVALFRYGVAVLVGMSAVEEEELVRLDGRIVATRRFNIGLCMSAYPSKHNVLPLQPNSSVNAM